LPSSRRRAIAFLIDYAICGILVGSFVGETGSKIHFRSKPAPTPVVTTDAHGATLAAGDAKLRADDKGLHGSAPDGNFVFDATGLHVTKAKPQKVVYDNKKGATVSADEDKDEDGSDDGAPWKRLVDGVGYSAILWGIYNLLFLKWLDGGSPGKMVMKLRVVGLNGQPIDKRQRMLRALFSVVSMHVAFLGYLWALWEPRRRTWHDLIAGTRVIPVE
jgi:uncharacterized RDD family membrane protein YckC